MGWLNNTNFGIIATRVCWEEISKDLYTLKVLSIRFSMILKKDFEFGLVLFGYFSNCIEIWKLVRKIWFKIKRGVFVIITTILDWNTFICCVLFFFWLSHRIKYDLHGYMQDIGNNLYFGSEDGFRVLYWEKVRVDRVAYLILYWVDVFCPH